MASNPGKIVKALFTFQQVFSAAKKKLKLQEFEGEHAGVKVVMDGRGNPVKIELPGQDQATRDLEASLLTALQLANTEKEKAAEAVLKNVDIKEIPWLGKLLKD